MKIGKYQFDSKEQAKTKIDALGIRIDQDGSEYPTHKHVIVNLGNIVLKPGKYDDDDNILIDPIFSKYWHLDVLWVDLKVDENGNVNHPYGWKSKSVNIAGNGVHSFFGLNYDYLKF